MDDNDTVKDSTGATVTAATDLLSDSSKSPKVSVLDGSGDPAPISPATRQVAIAHGANPSAVAAAATTPWYANRAGVPFVMGGHPNVVTYTVTIAAANGAQTDQAILSVNSGTKIVVTAWSVFCSNANTGDVDVKLGFSQNSPNTLPNVDTTARSGVLCDLHGIDANSGMARGDGSGILGVGADGADLLYTCTAPTAGHVTISVSLYTIDS